MAEPEKDPKETKSDSTIRKQPANNVEKTHGEKQTERDSTRPSDNKKK